MRYISTRNTQNIVSGAEAVLKGIAADGGLFVPQSFPKLTKDDLLHLCDMSYAERAAYVLNLFFDEFEYQELYDITREAYSSFEDENDPCPVMELGEGIYMLELWHGATCAFKDMALSVLPRLITALRKKQNSDKKTLILTATSGDTGKAALEGFKNVEGCEIMVFYPSEGVSEMQKLQMQTQEGDNVNVVAIKGNFDDAQSAVKSVFTDTALQKQLEKDGFVFSSANSINWGRLCPQIAYYISTYCDLLAAGKIEYGDKINFAVPSGNFGNILAGYYALQMGLPIGKLICASNMNKVLTDFFADGVYDINREFYKTISPSMDILISSNFERLLFEIGGRKEGYVNALMNDLKEKGKFAVDSILVKKLGEVFAAGFANEDETESAINNFFEEYDYLVDPHTAVACFVYGNYTALTGDFTDTVIISTANPYKFPCDVYAALEGRFIEDPFTAAERLYSISAMEIPQQIKSLQYQKPRFEKVIEKNQIAEEVLLYSAQKGKNGK